MSDSSMEKTHYADNINKSIDHTGTSPFRPFDPGSKLSFHYRTIITSNGQILDDSRGTLPAEVIIGKKFKLEIWEECLKTMAVGEVSTFIVDERYCLSYPLVMKSLRDIRAGRPQTSQCSGAFQMAGGTGYSDLDSLLKKPEGLTFTFELLSMKTPDDPDHDPDTWSMNYTERRKEIPLLREEGKRLFNEKLYEKAAQKYAKALDHLDALLTNEKPGDADYEKVDSERIVFFLNISQCSLLLGEYYKAIEFATEVLNRDELNQKALLRRGRAHGAVGNFDEAREDFKKLLKTDEKKMRVIVEKELSLIEKGEREKEKTDADMFGGKLL